MSVKPNLFFLIAGVLFINIAGFFLRYFDLETFFILLGFRFHFSIVISFLVLLNYIDFSSVKEMFVHPGKQKFIPLLLFAFLPLLFVPLDMFVLGKYNISEQDYFFELGLSSIVDYPVYLAWNTPQLIMFFIIMNTVITSPKQRFLKISLVTFFLFLYEIIPLEISEAASSLKTSDYLLIVSFILSVLIASLFISRIYNIYLFTILLFTILWGSALFFGSSSETLVNIFLASQYESWAGLVNLGKKFGYIYYLQPAYLLIMLIFSIIVLKRNNNSSAS